MGKILVFGGSFDPPHKGHMQALRTAYDYLQPEEAFVLPAYHSPNKVKHSTTPLDRLQMTTAALRDSFKETNVSVHPYEIVKKRRVYTHEVLERFSSYGEVFFLVGSDLIKDIPNWVEGAFLKNDVNFVVVERSGIKVPEVHELQHLTVVPGRHRGKSSTAIREMLRRDENISKYVPEGVVKYIDKNKLYGGKYGLVR